MENFKKKFNEAKEDKKKKRWDKQKTNIKMTDLNPTVSIILLHVKGLNTPTERFSDQKKSMLPTVYKKIILNVKTQAKSKRMGKNILCKHH